MISAQLRTLLKDALGIGWKGKGRTPWRNWTNHNERNPETSGDHLALVSFGLIVADPAKNYGRMSVYRVTEAGALEATGKKLPKKLAALLPAVEDNPPSFEQAIKLAA